MMKICKSCGKEYKGDYCEHCGYGNPDLKTKAADKYKKSTTPVRFMTAEQKAEYYEQKKREYAERTQNGKKRDPKQTRILIVAAVGVAVLIFGSLFASGVLGFNEEPDIIVEKYLTAIDQRDFDNYVSCFPKEMKRDYEKDLADTGFTEEEYMEEFNSVFIDEFGDNFKLEFNILRTDKLEEFSLDGYKQQYGTVPKVEEACIVVTDVTFKGSNGSEVYRMDFYLGKVGRRWKIFNLQYEAGIITPDMEINDPEADQTEQADDMSEQSDI